jgi:hypothetical protein
MSEFITHKLMFKFNKSDIIVKISDIEKISVNSIQLCQLKNVLYLSVSLRAAVNVDERQISVLLNLKMKVNLVEKRFLKAQHILFYWLSTQTSKHQWWRNNSVQHCWECVCLNRFNLCDSVFSHCKESKSINDT